MTDLNHNNPKSSSGNDQEEQIGLELQRFCAQFTRSAPEPELLSAYRLANQRVFSQAGGVEYEKQKKILRRAITARRDLEALEYAWRLVRPDNLLTKKIHIFMYLLETSPNHYHEFVNDKKQRTKAFLLLSLHTLRSAVKLCQGYFSLMTLRAGA